VCVRERKREGRMESVRAWGGESEREGQRERQRERESDRERESEREEEKNT